MRVSYGARAAMCSPRQPASRSFRTRTITAGKRCSGRLACVMPGCTMPVTLLVLGVPERTVMGIMGWSSTSMAARYQHVTDPIRHAVAAQVGGLLWADEKASKDAN